MDLSSDCNGALSFVDGGNGVFDKPVLGMGVDELLDMVGTGW